MRIGVLSDTHIPRTAEWLPKKVCEDLKNVDLILHAGDLAEIHVLERLNELAPTKAVCGNMDDMVVQRALPFKDIIEAGRFKIGLIHGYGPSVGLINRIGKEFDNVDAIVFGHSHSPVNETKNGILFFNPGSPTDKIYARRNSYGILEVNDDIKGKIIKL